MDSIVSFHYGNWRALYYLLLADCITVSIVKDAMESPIVLGWHCKSEYGFFNASALWIPGFGGAQEWFCYEQTKMVHTHDTTSLMYVVLDAEKSIPQQDSRNVISFHTETPKCDAEEPAIYHQLTSMKTSASVWVWYTWQSSWAKKAFCGQSRHNMTHATLHTFRLFLWSACK